jgi:hypothetical protein
MNNSALDAQLQGVVTHCHTLSQAITNAMTLHDTYIKSECYLPGFLDRFPLIGNVVWHD